MSNRLSAWKCRKPKYMAMWWKRVVLWTCVCWKTNNYRPLLDKETNSLSSHSLLWLMDAELSECNVGREKLFLSQTVVGCQEMKSQILLLWDPAGDRVWWSPGDLSSQRHLFPCHINQTFFQASRDSAGSAHMVNGNLWFWEQHHNSIPVLRSILGSKAIGGSPICC